MADVWSLLPQLEGAEANYVRGLFETMSEDTARRFAGVYAVRRKDSQTMLILALIGFLGVAGIHRFVLGQIGMGVLYLLTYGLCWIGTIVDLVNIKQMTVDYNLKVAYEVASMM